MRSLTAVVFPAAWTYAAVLAAVLAATGAYLIYSASVGERGRSGSVARPSTGPSRAGSVRPGRRSVPARWRGWLVQAGLDEVTPAQFVASLTVTAAGGALLAWLIFDAVAPAVLAGVLTASFPVTVYRSRRRHRLELAAESWPRVLEEIRLRTGSLGRSVPQALFESARRGPPEWRVPFAAAEREWLLTTDFARTLALLKERLADPTADVVAETLLLAHEVGGTDLDGQLAELIEDRVLDLQSRKDAASRQAGVRFARRFVLLVPLGMALAGLSIGTGRHAYATPGGQIAVVVGLVAVAGCWMWSGRLMRLPQPPRVFR